MKHYIPHIIISTVAVLLALGHIIYPGIQVDAATLTLIVIAVLPWLGFILKSVELPGGWKIQYRELERASEAAAKAGLLSPSGKAPAVPAVSTYVTIAEQDPNLALAGLRIEIERRLREIATKKGLQAERLSVGQLLRLLRANDAISSQEDSVLSDLIGLLSRAVHGADVDPKAAQWAVDVGPRLLKALDERITG